MQELQRTSLLAATDALFQRWADYRHIGSFDAFVEFALAVNGVAERLRRAHLPGLARVCENLDSRVLTLFGNHDAHPLPTDVTAALQRELADVLAILREGPASTRPRRRRGDDGAEPPAAGGRSRTVMIVGDHGIAGTSALLTSLDHFGFNVVFTGWQHLPDLDGNPIAILFAAGSAPGPTVSLEGISALRKRYPASQLLCTGVSGHLDDIVALQRAGVDESLCEHEDSAELVMRLIELVRTKDPAAPRVLVVEDSLTAGAYVCRALAQHDIESQAIRDPRLLLENAAAFRPDLILMDMHMPHCTGVEATRALRQIRLFRSIPVIYLSGEKDIALQVEALRLGGDQFLAKPVNPVLLAAVVKTQIQRYRELERFGRVDGLTGLYNHTASKAQLEALVKAGPPGGRLALAMIDIDHFKMINDTHGHPAGDQVIRGLAWLLTGRLRDADPIGRYGGEEFLAGFPGIGLDDAHARMDRLRADFAELPLNHARGALHASFSCGIAALEAGESVDSLIDRADQALLRAKALGRNRVVHA